MAKCSICRKEIEVKTISEDVVKSIKTAGGTILRVRVVRSQTCSCGSRQVREFDERKV